MKPDQLLIDIFARNNVNDLDVDNKTLLKSLYNDNQLFSARYESDDASWMRVYTITRKLKVLIEDIVKQSDNSFEQINNCLILFKSACKKVEYKIRILQGIIEKSLYEKIWDKEAKEIYHLKYDLIIGGQSFFSHIRIGMHLKQIKIIIGLLIIIKIQQ